MPTISGNLGMTLPESFDKVDVSVLSNNFSMIDAAFGQKVSLEQIANNLITTEEGKVLDARQGYAIAVILSQKAETADYTAVFSVDKWSSEAPYTQTVPVEGILLTDTPFIDVDMANAENSEKGASLTQAWTFIGRVVANEGSITAYCYEFVPEVDIPVVLKVVR